MGVKEKKLIKGKKGKKLEKLDQRGKISLGILFPFLIKALTTPKYSAKEHRNIFKGDQIYTPEGRGDFSGWSKYIPLQGVE